MKLTRFLVLALLLVAMVVTLVACDGGSDKKTTTNGGGNNNVTDTCPEGGEHTYEWVIKREPTCKVRGQKQEVCSKCGDEGKKDNIDPLAHVLGEVVTVEATCMQEGKKYQPCTNAGCDYQELIETSAMAAHNLSYETDSTGKYERVVCTNEYNNKKCSVNYVRHKADKATDIFNFHFGEAGFAREYLTTFFPGFEVEENGLDPYKDSSLNTIAAMKDAALNCALRVHDKNLVLKGLPSYVIQFDVMLTEYPEVKNTFVVVETKNSEGKAQYSKFLTLSTEGYLGFTDNMVDGADIKDAKLELNQWYNIAVVVRDTYDNGLGGDYSDRVRYDIYVNGEKLTLTTKNDETYTATEGAAHYPVKDMNTGFTVRISDGGYGSGDNNTMTHGKMALDNVLIYSGTTVKDAIRGTFSFPSGDVTVGYPTEIKEDEF